MNEQIQKCEICERVLQIGSEKIKDKYGITWTFGYSKGGCGSRQDEPSFTGEVCGECFNIFKTMVTHFNKELLFTRKGINKQKVGIVS